MEFYTPDEWKKKKSESKGLNFYTPAEWQAKRAESLRPVETKPAYSDPFRQQVETSYKNYAPEYSADTKNTKIGWFEKSLGIFNGGFIKQIDPKPAYRYETTKFGDGTSSSSGDYYNIIGETSNAYAYRDKKTGNVEFIDKKQFDNGSYKFGMPDSETQKKIRESRQKSSAIDKLLKAKAQSEFTKRPVGERLFERATDQAAKTFFGDTRIEPKDTGSTFGNIASDIVGGTAAFAFSPESSGQSLLSVSNKIGSKVAGKLPQAMGNSAAGRIAKSAIEGAATGAPLSIYEGVTQNLSPEETAKKALIDAGVGAGFGAVGRGAVEGFKSLKPVAQSSAKAVEEVAATNPFKAPTDAQVKYTTLREPKVIKQSADPFGQVKYTTMRSPAETASQQTGEGFGTSKLTVLKGESIKASEQVGDPRISYLKPMAGRTKNVENATDSLLENSATWKDRSALSLGRETPERVMESVAGKDAGKVKEFLIEPVKKGEADRVRFLNKERSDISNLGIKPKSKESQLLQEYGEGKITLDDLKSKTNDWQKVTTANYVIRSKYDEYLDKINAALTRNGYDPIPKRKDYFIHFQEVSDKLEMFGIPNNKLPTDINGITDDFLPGKNFFTAALKREGDKSTLDAIQGVDRYLEGASKLIYHTDNIQKLRTFEDKLRETYKGTDHLSNFVSALREYTNNLSGKKSRVDRAAEGLVGRRVYGIADRLRKQVGANAVGANVSSALTNFIPITQSLATTEKPAFVKGMLETIGNLYKNDGFVDKSDFLTRRVGSDPLTANLFDKAANKAGWLFKTIDNFVSQTIVRGKYNEGITKGLSKAEALKRADDWAARIMSDRSLGSTPNIFNSKTLGALTQFQLEVNNQMSFLFKDIPKTYNKAQAASALGQVFLYGYIFNNLFEKATGRRPAFDPIGIVQKAYDEYKDEEMAKGKATSNLIERISNQLPFSSFFYGGRIPLKETLPDVFGVVKGEKDAKKEFKQLVLGLAPPFGGNQFNKTIEGLAASGTITDIDPTSPTFGKKRTVPGTYGKGEDGPYLKYPIADTAANKVKTALFGQYSTPEAKDYFDKGTKALSAGQTEKLVDKKMSGADYLMEYGRLLKQRKENSINSDLNKTLKTSDAETAASSILKSFDERLKYADKGKTLERSLNNFKQEIDLTPKEYEEYLKQLKFDVQRRFDMLQKDKVFQSWSNSDKIKALNEEADRIEGIIKSQYFLKDARKER